MNRIASLAVAAFLWTVCLAMFSVSGAYEAATEGRAVSQVTPASGGPMYRTSSGTVVLLDTWYQGSYGVKRPNGGFWIDVDNDGILELNHDVVLTSVGLYIAGDLVSSGSLLAEAGVPIPSYFTGFEDRTSITLSFDNATSDFHVWPTDGSNAYYWEDQTSYTVTTTQTVSLATGTGGNYVIYFDQGTLTYAENPSHAVYETIIETKPSVGWVYYSVNEDAPVSIGHEAHGVQMSGATHHWIHDNIGTVWGSGGGISGYTLDSDADADVDFDISNIVFYDEDIKHEVVDGTSPTQYAQVLASSAEIPVLYKDDIDGSWAQAKESALPYLTAGTGMLAYNNDDGDGTFSQVECGNTKFMLYFMVVLNDWQLPVKMIQGQTQYNTQADAEAAAETEFVGLGDLPEPEMIHMYTFVMQTGSAYGGTKKCKIIAVWDYRTQATIGGAGVSDHGALGGLNDDDHPQYALDTDAVTSLALKADVDDVNTSLSLKSDIDDVNTSLAMYLRLDGSNSPSAEIDWGAQSLTNVSKFDVGTTNLVVNLAGYEDKVGIGTLIPATPLEVRADNATLIRARRNGAAGGSALIDIVDADSNVAYFGLIAGNFLINCPASKATLIQQNTTTKMGIYGSYVSVNAGDLQVHNNAYINYNGPEGASYIYFYDAGSATDEYLFWQEANDQFHFSDDLYIYGVETVASHLYIYGGLAPLTHTYNNNDGPDGDCFHYFYNSSSNVGEWFKWDDVDDRFEFSDDIYIDGGSLIGYATDSELTDGLAANNENHVTIGDETTTVGQSTKLVFNPAWFGVTDLGSSGSYVTFGGDQGTYTTTDSIEAEFLIGQYTLASDGIFDVAIPSGYDHIRILGMIRGTVAATNENCYVLMNDDSTMSNYFRASHYHGDSTGFTDDSSAYAFTVPGASSPASTFGYIAFELLDYENTSMHKVLHSLNIDRDDTAVQFVRQWGVVWESTNAVTTVTLQPHDYPTNDFLAGSVIWVYGQKSTDIVVDVSVNVADDIYLRLDGTNNPTAAIDFDGQNLSNVATLDTSGSPQFGGTSIKLNDDGPDADAYIYVYEDSSATGEYIKWDNTADYFTLSDELHLLTGNQLSTDDEMFSYTVSASSVWDEGVYPPNGTQGTGTRSMSGLDLNTNDGEYCFRIPIPQQQFGATAHLDQVTIQGVFDANDYITSTAVWSFDYTGAYLKEGEDETDITGTGNDNRLSADIILNVGLSYWFVVRFTKGVSDAQLYYLTFKWHLN